MSKHNLPKSPISSFLQKGSGRESDRETSPAHSNDTITRPRDLRSSKTKNTQINRFSRAATARCSLGASSQAWFDAAENLEEVNDSQSCTTWPRKNKINITTNEDADLEYNTDILKEASLVSVKGPIKIERTGFKVQPVHDTKIKRFWGLRLVEDGRKQITYQSPLETDDIIIRVNEDNLLYRSREDITSKLVEAFSKDETIILSVLRSDNIPCLPSISANQTPSSHNETSSLSRAGMSPASSHIKNLNAFNTRTIGQKISVDLVKLLDGGFGISLATRDTLVDTGEMQPVFIERIMPTGAAIEDGRLQFGDRLLSIDGVEVTTFSGAMARLKAFSVGEKTSLVFSRQEAVLAVASPPPTSTTTSDSPVDLLDDRAGGNGSEETPVYRTLTFEIPVPHPESGTSGLGIRFEEWKRPQVIHVTPNPTDPSPLKNPMVGDQRDDMRGLAGLFVKAVSPGTPADSGTHQTGVQAGDRLVAVNEHCVVGLSLSEIAATMKETIAKAQDQIARKKRRSFITLTVNRFFAQSPPPPSQRKSPSTAHRLPGDPEGTLTHRRRLPTQVSSVPEEEEEEADGQQKGGGNEDSNSETRCQRRMRQRTPSVDLRGRSRRDREDGSGGGESSQSLSSGSPVRCQSAFARDAVGRRSVSEKRHAQLSASSFKYFNDNVLPLRSSKGDDANSRLYSTMPASRRVRQLRRSKTGRKSGPLKPVHTEPHPAASSSFSSSSCPDGYVSAPPAPNHISGDTTDLLRTDGVETYRPPDLPMPSGFQRTRAHNHSFRAAISPRPSLRSAAPRAQLPGPLAAPKPPVHRAPPTPETFQTAAPPIPSRRSFKPPSDVTDVGDPPKYGPASSIPSAEVHHKAFQDFMKTRRSDRKRGYNLWSNRKGSTSSAEATDLPRSTSAAAEPPSQTGAHGKVVLKNVHHIHTDLQRIPSPVEFNAYVTTSPSATHEQYSNPHQPKAQFPRPTSNSQKGKPVSHFLEEVETCLPHRRGASRTEVHRGVTDETRCTNSDPSTTMPRRRFESPAPKTTVTRGNTTARRESRRSADAPDVNVSSRRREDIRDADRSEKHRRHLPRPHEGMGSLHEHSNRVMKSISPHAIVRPRSPQIAYHPKTTHQRTPSRQTRPPDANPCPRPVFEDQIILRETKVPAAQRQHHQPCRRSNSHAAPSSATTGGVIDLRRPTQMHPSNSSKSPYKIIRPTPSVRRRVSARGDYRKSAAVNCDEARLISFFSNS